MRNKPLPVIKKLIDESPIKQRVADAPEAPKPTKVEKKDETVSKPTKTYGFGITEPA